MGAGGGEGVRVTEARASSEGDVGSCRAQRRFRRRSQSTHGLCSFRFGILFLKSRCRVQNIRKQKQNQKTETDNPKTETANQKTEYVSLVAHAVALAAHAVALAAHAVGLAVSETVSEFSFRF